MPRLRAEDLQRLTIGPGGVQPQVQHALTLPEPLNRSGFKRFHLGLIMG